MTEATHFSQCVHDQQRRLEADSIRCAQLISGGRRRIRPPCIVPRSRSPTMRCIRLVIGASLSEPHINGTSAARVCYMYVYMSIVRRAIIQCRFLFCVHNSTFQHAMCARAARDQLGGAAPAGQVQPSTFRIHNVSTLSLFNVKWMPRAAASCVDLLFVDVLLFSLLPAWMEHGCYRHGCYKMLRIIAGQRGEATA